MILRGVHDRAHTDLPCSNGWICGRRTHRCAQRAIADVFMKTALPSRQGPLSYRRQRPRGGLSRPAASAQERTARFHGVIAVTAVTRGFAAISLHEASAHWPDVIHPSPSWRRRREAGRPRAWGTPQRREGGPGGALGATAGVTFEFGRASFNGRRLRPSLGPDPSGRLPRPHRRRHPGRRPLAAPPAVRQ